MGGDKGGHNQSTHAASLHMLQTEAVHLKDVVGCHHAEQQEENHAHPSHPLAKVHHPPSCGERGIVRGGQRERGCIKLGKFVGQENAGGCFRPLS